jgi:hypothetical protein
MKGVFSLSSPIISKWKYIKRKLNASNLNEKESALKSQAVTGDGL